MAKLKIWRPREIRKLLGADDHANAVAASFYSGRDPHIKQTVTIIGDVPGIYSRMSCLKKREQVDQTASDALLFGQALCHNLWQPNFCSLAGS